jgi:hypothetical protein
MGIMGASTSSDKVHNYHVYPQACLSPALQKLRCY